MSLCGVDSLVTNATINTKIQAKKLRCGPTKCHQLHIGVENKFCPEKNGKPVNARVPIIIKQYV